MRPRRTKILATLGPATDDRTVLEKVLRAGVDVVRLNFSHGVAEDHIRRAKMVREISAELGREIGILSDLQGPKIRIAKFREGKITLQNGASFVLDAALDVNAGDENAVGIDYKDLPKDVSAGDNLLLDDGRLVLQVTSVEGQKIMTRVIEGGILSNNKGINRQGGGLSAAALSDKDKEDLITAASLGTDFLAISFVRSAQDVTEARALLKAAGSSASIVSKIERVEAMTNLDEIIIASDAVMVARGDLGVEIGDAALPGVQKHIITRARTLDRVVIVATQMMESMIENSIPTRAEVFDVANAVIDGTDCVMLSAETASGKNPPKVIEAMARVCLGAEQERSARVSGHRLDEKFDRVDEAIAMATMYAANHLDVKAIVALTESGSTPLWMSRIRSGIAIYALSRHVETLRKMTLYRGVYPVLFDATQVSRVEVNRSALQTLQSSNILEDGDLVILTKGDAMGINGRANSMKILTVGNVL
jgi:pyruvate kinase